MYRLASALSHPAAWLGAPLVLTLLMYGSYRVSPPFFDAYMRPETGFIENATFAWFFLAFLFGVSIVRRQRLLPNVWVRTYFVLYTLGCFFVAAEEISWGQTWFDWATPEPIAELNEQGETSIHNIFELPLNRAPRTLLGIFVLATGVVWVVRNLWAGARYDDRSDWRHWIYPGFRVLPVALLATVSRWPFYIERQLGLDFLFIPAFGKYTEILEFQLGAFMLLYGAAVVRRTGGTEGAPARLSSSRSTAASPARAASGRYGTD